MSKAIEKELENIYDKLIMQKFEYINSKSLFSKQRVIRLKSKDKITVVVVEAKTKQVLIDLTN